MSNHPLDKLRHYVTGAIERGETEAIMEKQWTLQKTIHLSIKRWRDSIYGNSYFSTRCYVDDEEVARLPMQYGYGSAPEWEAAKALRDAGILPAGTCGLYQACRDAGVLLTIDDATTLKREVIAHGEKV